MHTEFTLKIEFHAPHKETIVTFINALKEAGRDLTQMAALMGEGTPTVYIQVENSQIGVKTISVFNGENHD